MRAQRFREIAIPAISVVLVVSTLLIAGLLFAIGPSEAPNTPTALPSEVSGVSAAGETPATVQPSSPTPLRATSTSTATKQSTPVRPPATATAPAAAVLPSPTTAPRVTVIAETQAGPGVSKSFDLPEGQYRVTFHADVGFELVLPVVESGDCGSEPLFESGAEPFDGDAIYWSTGCRVHFEVVGAVGGWSLNVETLGGENARPVPLEVSGDGPDLSPLVDLPAGNYLVAVGSQGPTIVVTPIVVDGECLERPIIVATAPGSYQSRYTSAGCRVIFQISAASGAWVLSITTAP